MNLKKAVVEIDERVYNQVIIDIDAMRIGQRLTLPKQETYNQS